MAVGLEVGVVGAARGGKGGWANSQMWVSASAN